jgi:murein DD-endopeptidase MepM/ murein hydrolase activator NlpD
MGERRYFFLLLFVICNTTIASAQRMNYPQDYFIAPIEAPLYLAGTFGELRGNHFHSGIDIKTQGRVNMPVLAAAEGYVSRIKVSPYGFGRALYLQHPNGYTTVYAHLRSFTPAIEDYLEAEQKRRKSNEVDLFPTAGQISFEKGEQIALSGNSGGSGGPHLHFEIRSTATEKIINPLLFGFEVTDNIYPELKDLQIYLFNKQEALGQKQHSLLDEGQGKYRLSGEGKVAVQGDFAFGIHAIDKLNGASNRNGVYELKLCVNNDLFYHFQMETYAFAETRYLNSHIDFALKDCCKRVLHKLYLDPNNQLSVYPHGSKGALLSFEKDTVVMIRIEAADIEGNTSELEFQLDYKFKDSAEYLSENLPLEKWSYQAANQYDQKGLSLDFKAGSFYRDIYLEHEVKTPCTDCLSDIHSIGSTAIPVQRYYDLAIKLKYLSPKWDAKKLCIVGLKEGNIVAYEGGVYSQGLVKTRTRNFGDFAIAIDSLAPSIKATNFASGKSIENKKLLFIEIRDNLSGINKYNAWIDDQWWPLYYDVKKKRLILNIEDLSVETAKHSLRLVVEDDKKNQSVENWELIVP